MVMKTLHWKKFTACGCVVLMGATLFAFTAEAACRRTAPFTNIALFRQRKHI